MKRNLFFLAVIIVSLISCSKESGLDALEADNVMEPANPTDVFVLDSVRKSVAWAGAGTYLQLFYHVKYELMGDTTRISKVVIYRNGAECYRLGLHQMNTYNPKDYGVSVGHTYTYTFAFMEENETLSKLSAKHVIVFP